jgi:hypothetical protein
MVVEGVAEDKIETNRINRQNGEHAIVAALCEGTLCNSSRVDALAKPAF